MRVALPTDENAGKSATVSGHFGRTKGFTIVDTDQDETEFVPHTGGRGPNANPPPVTPIQANADVVIADDIGRGAVSRIRNEAITVYCGAEGTVADALEQWREDELSEVEPNDVHGHGDGHGHGDCHCNCHDDGHHHDDDGNESTVPPFDR